MDAYLVQIDLVWSIDCEGWPIACIVRRSRIPRRRTIRNTGGDARIVRGYEIAPDLSESKC